MPLPSALPAHALAVVSLVLGLSGCAVVMAASGKPEPDLSVCTIGATAEQIEAQLGEPTSTQALPDGGSECRYAFWKGDPPSYGRAAAHAAADVLTYGLWEVIYGTRMEASGDPAHRYEMRVTYGADGRARDFVVERLADEEVEVLTGQVIEGAPLIDPIDARIGVHYPPELEAAVFKDRRLFAEGTKTREFRLRLGPSVVQLFDAALGAQFAAVEVIDRWPPTAAGRPDVAAVIEPRVEQATLDRVKLSVTLYRPDGAAYGAWTVTGRAQGDWPPSNAEQATARVEFALRNAAVQLLTQFRDQAPVRQMLAETGAGL
jgi:hypothetical protein